MKLDKKSLKIIKPWAILAVFCAILIYILVHVPDILSSVDKLFGLIIPLFYAIVIAYVLNIPMTFFENQLKKVIKPKTWLSSKIRGIAICITVIFTVLLFGVLLSIIIPQVIDSISMLMRNLVSYTENIIAFINDVLIRLNLEETSIEFDPKVWTQYVNTITANWQTLLQTATGWVGNAGQMIVKNAVAITVALGNWFMGFMLSLYLLASKEKFVLQLRRLIVAIFPNSVSLKIFEIGTRSNETFSNFIGGQSLEACILGLMMYIGMRLFGLGDPYEILISVIIALCSFVPMFGAMFSMTFGFFLILANNPIEALLFIVFYQTVQAIETNLIYPRTVGKSVGLPPIWILLSIVVFGGFFGFFGMLMAVPATAVIYTLLSEFIAWRLKQKQTIVTQNEFKFPQEEPDDK